MTKVIVIGNFDNLQFNITHFANPLLHESKWKFDYVNTKQFHQEDYNQLLNTCQAVIVFTSDGKTLPLDLIASLKTKINIRKLLNVSIDCYDDHEQKEATRLTTILMSPVIHIKIWSIQEQWSLLSTRQCLNDFMDIQINLKCALMGNNGLVLQFSKKILELNGFTTVYMILNENLKDLLIQHNITHMLYNNVVMETSIETKQEIIHLANLCSRLGILYTCIDHSCSICTCPDFPCAHTNAKQIVDCVLNETLNETCLHIIIQYPLTSYFNNISDFYKTLKNYAKMTRDKPTSMTVLEDVFPVIVDCMLKYSVGSLVCVNSGTLPLKLLFPKVNGLNGFQNPGLLQNESLNPHIPNITVSVFNMMLQLIGNYLIIWAKNNHANEMSDQHLKQLFYIYSQIVALKKLSKE